AAALARAFEVEAGSWPPAAGTWDVLVNTTPVGTLPASDASPMEGQRLDGEVVYDLVYNPRPTRLLRDAAAQGARTIDGLAMLVGQARRRLAWWTGGVPRAAVVH